MINETSRRGSDRYDYSRNDKKLSALCSAMRFGMKCHPVPCSGKDKNMYRLELENSKDHIVGISELEGMFREKGMTVNMTGIENMLEMLMSVLPEYIARSGRSVRLGNLVTFKPYATGTIEYIGAKPDPEKNRVEIRAVVSPVLRHWLRDVPLVNEKHHGGYGINFVIGDKSDITRDIVPLDVTFSVVGSGLYVPQQSASAPDPRGRVWVELSTGRLAGYGTVVASGPDLLKCMLELDPELSLKPGDHDAKVVVESYGTPEAYQKGSTEIFRYERKVKLRI